MLQFIRRGENETSANSLWARHVNYGSCFHLRLNKDDGAYGSLGRDEIARNNNQSFPEDVVKMEENSSRIFQLGHSLSLSWQERTKNGFQFDITQNEAQPFPPITKYVNVSAVYSKTKESSFTDEQPKPDTFSRPLQTSREGA